jgi:uncharacterized protein (DUF1330 family)
MNQKQDSRPAYCFFDVLEVTDPAKLEQCRAGVRATIEQYGGRYLTIGGQCDIVEGNWQPVFPVLIEFPSLEQAHRWGLMIVTGSATILHLSRGEIGSAISAAVFFVLVTLVACMRWKVKPILAPKIA